MTNETTNDATNTDITLTLTLGEIAALKLALTDEIERHPPSEAQIYRSILAKLPPALII